MPQELRVPQELQEPQEVRVQLPDWEPLHLEDQAAVRLAL